MLAIPERGALPTGRQKVEVADIFREYGEAYRMRHSLPQAHLKVMRAIEMCRTADLGGHVEQCDSCRSERISYNSCANRHCPKCQTLSKEKWLENRKAELLPVGYFHNVFTLPHALNPIALRNTKVIYNLLFKAVSETLKAFAQDPKHLGGQTGFIAILHTWNQRLSSHIHLHVVIPAGALSADGRQWIAPKRTTFLFPVKALSKVFRGKFIHLLEAAYADNPLIISRKTDSLGGKEGFESLIEKLWQQEWVVFSKQPFGGPEQVLGYLGRYTHRVAISNHRLLSIENSQVTLTYRDRRDGDKVKQMCIEAQEFIRRFLLHVLPHGFMRIRHFGFMANRVKQQNVERIRNLLGRDDSPPERADASALALLKRLTGVDLVICPFCKKGTMVLLREIPGPHQRRRRGTTALFFNSS